MRDRAQSANKRVWLAAVCLVLLAAALFAVWRAAAPRGVAGEKQITVQVVHGDGSSRDFALNTEEAYLGPALVAGGVVEDNQGPYGLYILTADGETADEGSREWWQITRGGEQVNTGADATPIADGERYELTLTVGYDG